MFAGRRRYTTFRAVLGDLSTGGRPVGRPVVSSTLPRLRSSLGGSGASQSAGHSDHRGDDGVGGEVHVGVVERITTAYTPISADQAARANIAGKA